MSFSQEVKKELVKIEYDDACCWKSLTYGMALFGKSFGRMSVSLQTESGETAALYRDLLYRICNVKAKMFRSPKGKNFTVSVTEKADCLKILGTFGHDGIESLKINHSNFDCERCRNAFLAGAFLACGTVSTPERDYHLEFVIPYLNLSKSFYTFLQEAELNPKTTNRKGYNIIYFKESETIEDFLYLMGASSAMFEMMNIKIVKDFRNNANRKANCETANIERMVNAVAHQIEAIEKIKKKRGFDYLTEDLKEMAELRLKYPDSSLAELARLSGMSRSGVNHRLKRIVEISKEL